MIRQLSFLLRFFAISFLITYVILFLFITLLDGGFHRLLSGAYLLTVGLYYYFLLLLILLPFLTISIFVKYGVWIIVVLKTLFDTFLLIDFFVLRNYGFHIDALFIDMLLHDLGGIGISWFGYALATASTAILFLANVWSLRIARKKLFRVWRLNGVLFALLLANQFTHAWADYFHQSYITRHTPYFPYFFPLTSVDDVEKLSKRFVWIKPKQTQTQETIAPDFKNGAFDYPKHPLVFEKRPQCNVMWIVLESWRADTLQKEIMPHVTKFAQDNLVFLNHFSGGNATLSGLYSLFYGLYATQNLRASMADPQRYPALFSKALSAQGYDLFLYTSSNFHRFQFKEMFFPQIDDDKLHIWHTRDIVQNDAELVRKAIRDINLSKQKPWFKFLFLTSSHFPYRYPKSSEKFVPVETNMEAFLINRFVDDVPYRNKYHNALHYLDTLLEPLLETLNNQSNCTITILTGDHAEEFNDNQAGMWGHGGNFTAYQTQVPLIMSFSHTLKGEVKRRTYHVDIVPTLLHYLGVKNPASDYSNGVNLLDRSDKEKATVFASYKHKAYLVGNTVVSVGLTIKKYDIYDYHRSRSLPMEALRDIRKEEGRFFKGQ